MSSRLKAVLAVAVAVLVVVVWFFFYFRPAGDDLSEKEDALEQARAEQLTLEDELESLQTLDEEAPSQEAELRRLNAAVPPEPELDTFILEANEIAVESGIDWLAISPAPPSVGAVGGASVITMAIDVEGGFFQVLDYLNRLEELERLVVVDDVSISAGGTGDATSADSIAATGAPRLSMTLNARMFTRSDAAFGGADEGTAGGGAATGTGETGGTDSDGGGTATSTSGTGQAPEGEPGVTTPTDGDTAT